MKPIVTLADLEKEFSIDSLTKVTDYDAHFRNIAESLFANFAIQNGPDIYRFVEIEFYLNTTETKDHKISYPRQTSAGEWFLHESGVDLAFESNDDVYGGILIRSIKSGTSYEYKEGDQFINGPRKSSWYILDGQNAFGHDERLSRLIEAPTEWEAGSSMSFTRHGIKNDDKQFRFTIPLGLWEKYCKGYSAFPHQ